MIITAKIKKIKLCPIIVEGFIMNREEMINFAFLLSHLLKKPLHS